MTAPLLFLDTETTGLHPDRDEVWEIAAVLRDDQGEHEFHAFVQHEPDLCRELPASFHEDHQKRYPINCQTGERTDWSAGLWVRSDAMRELIRFVGDARPHLVGMVPSFDAERLGRLIYATQGPFARTPWHYHLIDAETLAVGYLRGQFVADQVAGSNPRRKLPDLPWHSEALSLALGVDPEQFARHTAMGDVRWTMAIYDAVVGR